MPEKYFKASTNKLKFTTPFTRKEVHHRAVLVKAEELVNKVKQSKTVKIGKENEKDDSYNIENMDIRPPTPDAQGIDFSKNYQVLLKEIE